MTDTADTDMFRKQVPVLIRNAWINGKLQEMYLEDGKIAAISEKIADHDAEFIIDADKATVLPGLVNMHTHAAMELLRGYADDMELFEWLSTKIWPTEAHLNAEDTYAGVKLACLEMIRTGTTAFNDMYFRMEAGAKAVDEMGIRGCLTYCTIDNGNHDKLMDEERITKETVSNIRKMNNPRITSGVGPHAVYTVCEEGLSWCAEYAEKENLQVHIHVSETEQEVKDCVAAHGMSPVKWLEHCGVLSDRCVAAHCCYLDSQDIAIFAKHGVTAVNNPVSNMKLAGARAIPYEEMKKAGVNVALGTDGASSNNALDMFTEMKTAAILQKFYWKDPTAMPAADALKMATENGAKALGIHAGVLAPGYLADVILVGRNPSAVPRFSAESNAVYATSGMAVNTTICNGEILMYDGFIPGAEEIMEEAEKAAFALTERARAAMQ
ncbi:MAG TPA: amidohydrolase family protein [Methanocorpusculum sp.]|nr:amidohydrolase family protein [Methanocorpusculum sp.]